MSGMSGMSGVSGASGASGTRGVQADPKPRSFPPGTWLGLLGGGQLGRMFTMAAQSMGYKVCVLDPAPDSPAGASADRQIVAPYDDLESIALRIFAALSSDGP